MDFSVIAPRLSSRPNDPQRLIAYGRAVGRISPAASPTDDLAQPKGGLSVCAERLGVNR